MNQRGPMREGVTVEAGASPSRGGVCVGCGAKLDQPMVCTGCSALQPVGDAADHFTLLGVPRMFDVSAAVVRDAFVALCRRVHPDFHTGQNEASETLATRWSARLNEAYEVLGDPVRRASYLLELTGGPDVREVRDVPGDLLMQSMQWRERMDEDREGVVQEVRDARTRTMEEMASMARRIDELDDDGRRTLRVLLNAFRYYENLLHDRRDLIG